jgi:hypothetical protein
MKPRSSNRPGMCQLTQQLLALRRSGVSIVRNMVNPGEVPIKALIIHKLKMLSGLDQKVRG